MPDYIVKADVFERGMKRHWHRSDRFRMFFASSYGHKAGGMLIVCIIARSTVHMAVVLQFVAYYVWQCMDIGECLRRI